VRPPSIATGRLCNGRLASVPTYNSLTDPLEWVFTSTDARPCVAARKPFGLITIANSDAAASPHTDAAFLEAHRAVSEVVERRAYPFVRKPMSS